MCSDSHKFLERTISNCYLLDFVVDASSKLRSDGHKQKERDEAEGNEIKGNGNYSPQSCLLLIYLFIYLLFIYLFHHIHELHEKTK